MIPLCLILLLIAPASALAEHPRLPPFGITAASMQNNDDPAYARPDYDDSHWPVAAWHDVEERGVWWLRQWLSFPDSYLASGVPVGLYLSASASAEVWWDGEMIGRNGRVAHRRAEEIPGLIDAVIPIPAGRITPGEHLLAVRFSSRHAGPGIATPVDSLFIAPYGSPRRWAEARYRPALIMGGALLLAAGFLTVLRLRERGPSVTWLLLACLAAIAQLAFEVARAYWSYPYSLHEARLLGIAVFTAVGGVGVLGYLLQRFRQQVAWAWLAGFGAIAVLMLLSGNPIGPVTWFIILIWLLTAAAVCALAVRRSHQAAWVAIGALGMLLVAMVMEPDAFIDRTYFLGMVGLLLLFFADTVANHARVRRERDVARLRSARLQLELLKRHLRPHFLMNTLTTLSEWLETEPATGAVMIDALAREFRLLDRMADRRLVAFADELALCRAHLEVMGFRQGRSYDLVVRGATGFQVPPAILHTLIENALTHGDGDEASVRFELDAHRHGERVHLEFTGPGAPSDTGTAPAEGTGLGYVRARLEEAFGDQARLESGATAGGWRTCIEIPLVEEPDPTPAPVRRRRFTP